jgi:hypothetical protein
MTIRKMCRHISRHFTEKKTQMAQNYVGEVEEDVNGRYHWESKLPICVNQRTRYTGANVTIIANTILQRNANFLKCELKVGINCTSISKTKMLYSYLFGLFSREINFLNIHNNSQIYFTIN